MQKRQRPPTVEEYRQHVVDLARAFGVDLIFEASPIMQPEDAVSLFHPTDTTRRAVIARPVEDEASYAVALHEMGHCCALNGRAGVGTSEFKKRALVLLREDAAWEWAEHHALDWTPTMEHTKRITRGTYDRYKEPPDAAPPPQPTAKQKAQEERDRAKRARDLKRFMQRIK